MSRAALLLVLIGTWPGLASGQALSPADRQALVTLHVERGGRAADLDGLLRIADDAGARGLPVQPLTNKIREGLAKRADPRRIEAVVRQLAADLDASDRLLREQVPSAAGGSRQTSVILLAESLAGGVTPEEVRELGRQAQPAGKSGLSAETLAGAAKGLAFIKDAELPVADGTAVVAEGARQGYGAGDLVDLGREIKRLERDYRSGRATLVALRDAIARGDRPDQLFRDRPDRAMPIRPERSPRPEPPGRPERAERPERPVRPELPERPAAGR